MICTKFQLDYFYVIQNYLLIFLPLIAFLFYEQSRRVLERQNMLQHVSCNV